MGLWINFKAITVRILFQIHIIFCVWRIVIEKNYWGWWFIAVGTGVLMFIEASFTLHCNKRGEWKRCIPCIFIYLLGTVPVLILIEWSSLQTRLKFKEANGLMGCPQYVGSDNKTEKFNFGVIEVDLAYDTWLLALQQIMVFLLVAGRWFLPKGQISRAELSNMLLAYVGMAADILEFLSEGVQTDAIRCEKLTTLIILVIWGVSLLQFPLTLNLFIQQRQRKQSLSVINETIIQRCQNSEVLAIFVTIFIQDGPFLVVRLFLIVNYKIIEQGLIFFTFKNILVVMLQLYRLWILLCLTWDKEESKFSFRVTAAIRQTMRSNGRHSTRQPAHPQQYQPEPSHFHNQGYPFNNNLDGQDNNVFIDDEISRPVDREPQLRQYYDVGPPQQQLSISRNPYHLASSVPVAYIQNQSRQLGRHYRR